MLGLPPAFVLSQDQTLQFDLYINGDYLADFFFLTSDAEASQKPFNEQLLFYWLALLLNFSLIFGFHRCRELFSSPSARAAYTRVGLSAQVFFLKKNEK